MAQAAAWARRRARLVALKIENPEEYERRRVRKNTQRRARHASDPTNGRARDRVRDKMWRTTPEGRIRVLVNKAKGRAREIGLEFNIHRSDIYIPSHCPVLGIPLRTDPDGPLDNRYSLDRSDSSKGYVRGNVKIISFRANTIKGNATAAELRAVADYVESLEQLDKLIS